MTVLLLNLISPTLSGLHLFCLYFVPHIVIYGRGNLQEGGHLHNLAFKSLMHDLTSTGMNNVELYFAYSGAKLIAMTKLCSVPNSPKHQIQCCDQKNIHDMLQYYCNVNIISQRFSDSDSCFIYLYIRYVYVCTGNAGQITNSTTIQKGFILKIF
jgi:hypothetical protein